LFADYILPFSAALVLLALLAIIKLVRLGDFGTDLDVASGLGSAGFADCLLGRILPQYETSGVSVDSLVGCRATISIGRA
jgi:multisubunit Na+/H+ antiporter MnhG subunit